MNFTIHPLLKSQQVQYLFNFSIFSVNSTANLFYQGLHLYVSKDADIRPLMGKNVRDEFLLHADT